MTNEILFNAPKTMKKIQLNKQHHKSALICVHQRLIKSNFNIQQPSVVLQKNTNGWNTDWTDFHGSVRIRVIRAIRVLISANSAFSAVLILTGAFT